MFPKVFIILLAGGLLLAACTTPEGAPARPVEATQAPATAEPQPATEAPAATKTPAASEGPAGTAAPAEAWRPQPGDEQLMRGEAFIEETGILTLESFPPQFVLHVVGSQGDPCRVVRAVVPEPDAQNRIQVEIYTLVDPAVLCAQVIKGFELDLPLGSLPKGEYGVFVNGSEVGTVRAP